MTAFSWFENEEMKYNRLALNETIVFNTSHIKKYGGIYW